QCDQCRRIGLLRQIGNPPDGTRRSEKCRDVVARGGGACVRQLARDNWIVLTVVPVNRVGHVLKRHDIRATEDRDVVWLAVNAVRVIDGCLEGCGRSGSSTLCAERWIVECHEQARDPAPLVSRDEVSHRRFYLSPPAPLNLPHTASR